MIKFLKRIASTALILVLLAGLWLLVGTWWSLPLPQPGVQKPTLLLENISIVDVVAGDIRPNHAVLIESGLIVDVGPGLVAPGAERMDGGGAYLVPGLFDMHVHSTRLAPWLMHPLFIAAGVTAVRDMGGCIGKEDGFVACIDQKRDWDRLAASGQWVGPRYDHVTSLAINGGREIPNGMDTGLGVPDAEGARSRVALDKQRGVDFLKPYTMIPRDGYLALAREAAEADIYLAGHLPLEISALEAIEAGQRSIEHAFLFIWDCFPGMSDMRHSKDPRQVYTDELRRRMLNEHDPALCAELHRKMAATGTAFVPTHTTRKLDAFSTDEVFRSDSRLRFIPDPLRRMWLSDADAMARRAGVSGVESYRDFYRFGIEQTGLAHRAGVTVLAGSDTPDSFAFPGFALHDELEHLVSACMSPLDALRSATVKPATFLGLEGQAGVILPGARADLVLLRSNPLRDIGAIREIDAVVLAGAVYDRERLDRMLTDVERIAGSWSMWPKFLWQLLTSPIMKRQFAD